NLLQGAFRGEASLLVSVLMWGEVFYHFWQQHGGEKARQNLATLSRLNLTLVLVDTAQALKAGEIKAQHKIPYVDCVAAALAEISGATLVTSDRHFEKLGRRVQILW